MGSDMLVFYTDKIQGAYKMKLLPFVKMNSKHQNDIGLHQHEYEHVKQYLMLGVPAFIITLLLSNWFFALLAGAMAHDLLYTFSTKYRQWSEVSAFKKQLKYGGSIDIAAQKLSSDYGLMISKEEALRLLSK
jgi:hypothetical protein